MKVKKFIASILTLVFASVALLSIPLTAKAQTVPLGQSVKACNMTAREEKLTIREQYQNGEIGKQERKTELKAVETERRVCVKTAKQEARARRLAIKAAKKACIATARTERSAVEESFENSEITEEQRDARLMEIEETFEACMVEARNPA